MCYPVQPRGVQLRACHRMRLPTDNAMIHRGQCRSSAAGGSLLLLFLSQPRHQPPAEPQRARDQDAEQQPAKPGHIARHIRCIGSIQRAAPRPECQAEHGVAHDVEPDPDRDRQNQCRKGSTPIDGFAPNDQDDRFFKPSNRSRYEKYELILLLGGHSLVQFL